MRLELIISILFVLILIAISFVSVGLLPENGQIPIHWNLEGDADRFVDKEYATRVLWALPLFGAGLAALFCAVPVLDPFKANIRKGQRAYKTIWLGSLALYTAIGMFMAYSMVRGVDPNWNSANLYRGLIMAIAFAAILVGNILPKTRPSYFLGLRTPWTLTSDLTWEKTNRLGGRLMVAGGTLTIITAIFFKGLIPLIVLVSTVTGAGVVASIYSYFVWRSSPDRQETTDYV